jgi:hypothetical protein
MVAQTPATTNSTTARPSSVTIRGVNRRPHHGQCLTAAALLLALFGCATPSHLTAQPDTPPQSGAALAGWAFFFGGGGHMVLVGVTGRSICEAMRAKMLDTEPHTKPSPCVPVKVTAD